MSKIIRLLLLVNFLNIFGFSLFAPLYAIFAQNINGNVLTIATTYGVYTIATGISMLLFGLLEDSIKNKRKVIVSGYFILSIGAFSFLLVENITQLLVVQVINAIGAGLVTPAWKAVYSKYEDKGREAGEWSFYDGGNAIVIGIASIVGGFIVSEYGFKIVIVLFGSIQLFAAFLSLRLLKYKK